MSPRADIYAGIDPGDAPAYSLTEAARYLSVARATLACWFFGQDYRAAGERRRSRPVIAPAAPIERLLSFRNLVEAHVLSSLRTLHNVPLPQIRETIALLRRGIGAERPLIEVSLRAGGGQLFANTVAGLVSSRGQLTLHGVIDAYLSRVEHEDGNVVRLYPFTRKRELADVETLLHQPRFVVITPRIGFGRPVLSGTNIRTSVIVERYLAGESIAELAEDYRRSPSEVEEAIRSEYPAAA